MMLAQVHKGFRCSVGHSCGKQCAVGGSHLDIEAAGSGVCDGQCIVDDGGCDDGGVGACVDPAMAEDGSVESDDTLAVAPTKEEDDVARMDVSNYVFVTREACSARRIVDDLVDEHNRLLDLIRSGVAVKLDKSLVEIG